MLDKMLENKKACMPETGFNLVAFDDYEPPGEQLAVLANYDTEDEANAAKDAFVARNDGNAAFVYGTD